MVPGPSISPQYNSDPACLWHIHAHITVQRVSLGRNNGVVSPEKFEAKATRPPGPSTCIPLTVCSVPGSPRDCPPAVCPVGGSHVAFWAVMCSLLPLLPWCCRAGLVTAASAVLASMLLLAPPTKEPLKHAALTAITNINVPHPPPPPPSR